MRTPAPLAVLLSVSVLGLGLSAVAKPEWPSRRTMHVVPASASGQSHRTVTSEAAAEPARRLGPERDEQRLRERFRDAHRDLERGRFRAAAESFEALAEEWPALRDVSLHFAGSAWMSVKPAEAERAIAVLEEVAPASHRYLDSLRLLSRADESLGEFARAAKRLEPLTAADSAHAAHLRIAALQRAADLQRRAGDLDAAKTLRLRLWSQFPQSASARRAASRLKAQEISALARAERADVLSNDGRGAEARAETRRVLARTKLPDDAACLARVVNAKLARKERRHREVVATLTPVLEQCRDASLRPRALYLLATSTGILDAEKGRVLWAQLAEEHPEHPFADDALYAAAELELKRGDTSAALARLDALAERYPEGDYAGEALFRRFFIRWSVDDSDAAARVALERYEAATRDPRLAAERPRALYWLGRVLAQGERAEAAWGELLLEYPTTIYAVWAEERLGDRAGAVRARALAGTDLRERRELALESLAEDPAWQAAVALHRLGLRAEAERAFAYVNLMTRAPATVLAAAHFLRAEGFTHALRAIPERSLSVALKGPLDARSEALWAQHRPQSYGSLIDAAAERAGVEPDLFRGLVHRESRFNPKARSGVGALGLAQVMPATAKEELRRTGRGLKDPAELYDPRLNARVGAGYLSRLLRQYGDRPELALAAYNGGPGRVSRWWSERSSDEVDVFVESIPIEETRAYVKNVMGSAAAYRALRQHSLVASAPRPPRG